jgi:hypothetical protein
MGRPLTLPSSDRPWKALRAHGGQLSPDPTPTSVQTLHMAHIRY